MRKYIILALLFVPMVSFGASSVRVLGGQSATPASTTSVAKVTPAKPAVSSVGGSAVSRVGAVRATNKTNASTSSSATSASTSRFPVITPAHSYSSVVAPKPTGTTSQQPAPASVDVDAIVNNLLQNYYNKTEVNNIVNALEPTDDPRFDMVRVSDRSPDSYWRNHKLYQQRLDEGYVFMWVED